MAKAGSKDISSCMEGLAVANRWLARHSTEWVVVSRIASTILFRWTLLGWQHTIAVPIDFVRVPHSTVQID